MSFPLFCLFVEKSKKKVFFFWWKELASHLSCHTKNSEPIRKTVWHVLIMQISQLTKKKCLWHCGDGVIDVTVCGKGTVFFFTFQHSGAPIHALHHRTRFWCYVKHSHFFLLTLLHSPQAILSVSIVIYCLFFFLVYITHPLQPNLVYQIYHSVNIKKKVKVIK